MKNKDEEHLPYIPYYTGLKELARVNRKKFTKAEQKIWDEILRCRQRGGLKFLRQKPIEGYIVDFYCPKLMLVIEIDGGYHSDNEAKEYDENRTIELEQYGIIVIRYTNEQVLNGIDAVKESLLIKVKSLL